MYLEVCVGVVGLEAAVGLTCVPAEQQQPAGAEQTEQDIQPATALQCWVTLSHTGPGTWSCQHIDCQLSGECIHAQLGRELEFYTRLSGVL